MGSSRSTLVMPSEETKAESSKPHKEDDFETQFSSIPDAVLSNTLFP